MRYYSPLVYRAMHIAFDAHRGQYDKSGAEYIYHPAYLASQMNTEDEIITALLHDVVEDTDITLGDLGCEDFSPDVMEALKLLTHDDGSDYMDYIRRIKGNPLATTVKLADLQHNSNPTRNKGLPPGDAERYRKKYDAALKLLREVE